MFFIFKERSSSGKDSCIDTAIPTQYFNNGQFSAGGGWRSDGSKDLLSFPYPPKRT